MTSMRTIQFGEIKTSVLGFGCASVMGRVGRGDSLWAMHAAWEAGVTLFDTARSYGYGEAEGLLGDFLMGRRAQATIVTKFGIVPAAPAQWKRFAKPLARSALAVLPQAKAMLRRSIANQASPGHFDVATLRHSLDQSLRNLRTDYVDILLAHEAPASVMAQDDLMAELEATLRAGKARRCGLACSLATAQQLVQRSPTLLGALQTPAALYPPTEYAPLHAHPELFTMANHPFGGDTGARHLQTAMQTLLHNPNVPATLRDKLQDDAKTSAARFVFSHLLHQHFNVIVPSMLQLTNVAANVAAIEAEVLSLEECAALRQWLVPQPPR